MTSLTVESEIHFHRRRRGALKIIQSGSDPEHSRPSGRIPRISRLMALAIRFDELISEGEVADYAELSRLGSVSRARITQIMNLLMLAPDIQESLLHLDRVTGKRKTVLLQELQQLAVLPDWRHQRQMWKALQQKGV